MTITGGALLGVLGAGCGSTGNGAGPDGSGTPVGGGLTWKDNGAAHSALFPSAALVRSATLDLLEIAGGDANLAVALGVGVNPPPLAAGSYTCGGAGYPIVSLGYTGEDGHMLACSVDLASVGLQTGAHVIGTFSGSVSVTGGAVKTITDGKFDLALNVASQ